MLNEHGLEIPDDTPVEIPTRLKMPVGQVERMRQIVRQEMSLAASMQGEESFEEADDFELEESESWVSPYEMVFEPEPQETSPLQVSDPAGVKSEPSAGEPPAVKE